MRATFALLADTKVHNLIRKLSWHIHQRYRTGIDVCRLPPHISLKQPFEEANLDSLETYMGELAQNIRPFHIRLTHLELIDVNMDDLDTGILWLDVEETEFLHTVQELAMFVYDERNALNAGYMTYRVFPLSGSESEMELPE